MIWYCGDYDVCMLGSKNCGFFFFFQIGSKVFQNLRGKMNKKIPSSSSLLKLTRSVLQFKELVDLLCCVASVFFTQDEGTIHKVLWIEDQKFGCGRKSGYTVLPRAKEVSHRGFG